VARAQTVLEELERGDREGSSSKDRLIDDLPLFAATPPPPSALAKQSAVEERLKDVHPDEMTAREALNLLYELKAALKD
jgi:DNA mismatch repair protein MutS